MLDVPQVHERGLGQVVVGELELVKDAIIARRGTQARNTAKVAAARELLTLIFYAMRDGHIRRASRPEQAA